MISKKLIKVAKHVVRFLARGRKKIARFIRPAAYTLTAVVLLANLFPGNLSPLEKAATAVMKNPGDGLAHLSLAKIFLANNNIEEAEKEIVLSETDNKKSAEISGEIAVLKEKIDAPKKTEEKILGWQKVAKEKPDFRDAYLELALLNYQLGRTEMAKYFLGKALFLDPNFPPARELERTINEGK
ncbi:MAG: hypothetical protein Q8N98_05560 [bacterium]|nr:hypothetical protein [bacterium]